jgi:hypothetical protein
MKICDNCEKKGADRVEVIFNARFTDGTIFSKGLCYECMMKMRKDIESAIYHFAGGGDETVSAMANADCNDDDTDDSGSEDWLESQEYRDQCDEARSEYWDGEHSCDQYGRDTTH